VVLEAIANLCPRQALRAGGIQAFPEASIMGFLPKISFALGEEHFPGPRAAAHMLHANDQTMVKGRIDIRR
jgi:hypothetical protein